MSRVKAIVDVLINHAIDFAVEYKDEDGEMDYWRVSVADIPDKIFEQVVADLGDEELEVTIRDDYKYRIYVV